MIWTVVCQKEYVCIVLIGGKLNFSWGDWKFHGMQHDFSSNDKENYNFFNLKKNLISIDFLCKNEQIHFNLFMHLKWSSTYKYMHFPPLSITYVLVRIEFQNKLLKLDLFQSWFGDSQYYRLRKFFVIFYRAIEFSLY